MSFFVIFVNHMRLITVYYIKALGHGQNLYYITNLYRGLRIF